MYALPQQTLAGALRDVEKAITLQTPHLSHYQLTLEPNTQFAANPPPLPDEDSAWDMQEACQARIAAAGFAQYEVSAYARPWRECVHNLNYWHFGDYLGIGAGAHAELTDRCRAEWRRGCAGAGSCARRAGILNMPAPRVESAATMRSPASNSRSNSCSMRCAGKWNSTRGFSATTGLARESMQPRLDAACERGWLRIDSERLQPTESGRRFLNDLITLFLP